MSLDALTHRRRRFRVGGARFGEDFLRKTLKWLPIWELRQPIASNCWAGDLYLSRGRDEPVPLAPEWESKQRSGQFVITRVRLRSMVEDMHTRWPSLTTTFASKVGV